MIERRTAAEAGPGVSLPAGVTIESRGDLDVLVLDGGPDGVYAEVALQGGQVLSWCPPGGDEVLFCSELARFERGVAVRGGIPVCFPWFGPGPSGTMSPAHGWARTSPWRLVAAERADEAFTVALTVGPPDGPEPELRLDLRAGRALELAVTVTGAPGTQAELALHTYLGLGDVRQARVEGLDGAEYADQLTGERHRQDGAVTFTAETDRVYLAGGPFTVRDEALGRAIRIEQEGFGAAVVWNPWVQKAARTADLGDGEWRGFCCVESAAVREQGIVTGPDGTWRGRVRITAEERS